jgi:hypothetical protein
VELVHLVQVWASQLEEEAHVYISFFFVIPFYLQSVPVLSIHANMFTNSNSLSYITVIIQLVDNITLKWKF